MKYRSKVVEIEAIRWNGKSVEVGDGPTPGWIREALNKTPETPGALIRCHDEVHVFTLEGTMIAKPGDWIIRGTEGELYPCKPSVFERKYEAV